MPVSPDQEKWYYDACTLDRSKSAYAEMFSKSHPIKPVISHLAIGEAYANCQVKKKPVDAFVMLMDSLSEFVEIVGNDNCGEELKAVQEECPRLSVTDGLHLATALHNRCVIVRSIDPDLWGLSKKALSALAKRFNLRHFNVTKMNFSS